MPTEVVVALIAAAGVVLGGILSAVASGLSTRHKLKELELQYLQEKRSQYLANAREHMRTIYIPLQASITRLVLRFEDFRRSPPGNGTAVARDKAREFSEAAAEFIKGARELLHSGADAFLTTELSEALRSFLSFLEASQQANEAREKLLVSYRFGLPVAGFYGSHEGVVGSRRLDRVFKGTSVSMGITGVGFTAERVEVVEAPIDSAPFERRFIADTVLLRGHIKEVTLGSRALPS